MGGDVKRFSLCTYIDENIVLKLRGHEQARNISYLRRLVGLELPAFDQNTILWDLIYVRSMKKKKNFFLG